MFVWGYLCWQVKYLFYRAVPFLYPFRYGNSPIKCFTLPIKHLPVQGIRSLTAHPFLWHKTWQNKSPSLRRVGMYAQRGNPSWELCCTPTPFLSIQFLEIQRKHWCFITGRCLPTTPCCTDGRRSNSWINSLQLHLALVNTKMAVYWFAWAIIRHLSFSEVRLRWNSLLKAANFRNPKRYPGTIWI